MESAHRWKRNGTTKRICVPVPSLDAPFHLANTFESQARAYLRTATMWIPFWFVLQKKKTCFQFKARRTRGVADGSTLVRTALFRSTWSEGADSVELEGRASSSPSPIWDNKNVDMNPRWRNLPPPPHKKKETCMGVDLFHGDCCGGMQEVPSMTCPPPTLRP